MNSVTIPAIAVSIFLLGGNIKRSQGKKCYIADIHSIDKSDKQAKYSVNAVVARIQALADKTFSGELHRLNEDATNDQRRSRYSHTKDRIDTALLAATTIKERLEQKRDALHGWSFIKRYCYNKLIKQLDLAIEKIKIQTPVKPKYECHNNPEHCIVVLKHVEDYKLLSKANLTGIAEKLKESHLSPDDPDSLLKHFELGLIKTAVIRFLESKNVAADVIHFLSNKYEIIPQLVIEHHLENGPFNNTGPAQQTVWGQPSNREARASSPSQAPSKQEQKSGGNGLIGALKKGLNFFSGKKPDSINSNHPENEPLIGHE